MEVVNGERQRPVEAAALVDALEPLGLSGTLYLGYPVLRSLSGGCIVDALLISREAGVLAMRFTRSSEADIAPEDAERVDSLYVSVERQLKAHDGLRAGRDLGIPLDAVGVLPPGQSHSRFRDVDFYSVDDIAPYVASRAGLSDSQYQMVNEALEGMASVRPASNRSAAPAGSKGAIMHEIERHIANLDWYQKRGAIEFPEGPQRIRGLAGSGKTIVLAMKTAYLHGSHPDWDIAVTFQTRALQQQLRDLIRGFHISLFATEPDFERVQVIHAWGSSRQRGFYSDLCRREGLIAKDFSYAKSSYGRDRAFGGVCEEFLREAGERNGIHAIWDVVLIDEAQDFPPSFFELAYLAAKDPHRVVFAYDELQNLSNQTMRPVSELFGVNEAGDPRVADLAAGEDEPARDIVLPVCYRNTPWALTIAHALGFGVYREGGLIQFFDSPDLWDSVGYEILEGSMSPGTPVCLARKAESFPAYFTESIEPSDAVTSHVFGSKQAEAEWVAEEVQRDLGAGGLKFRDVLIIMSDPIAARDDATRVVRALADRDIAAHVAGVTSTVDALFEDDSIAVTGIYRAKGNEAAMVYILDAEYSFDGYELIKRRNILFTAMTRSRGWVRICGCGEGMVGLQAEVQRVVEADYQLRFTVPTANELAALRRIHRDLTPAERGKAKKAESTLAEYLAEVESGAIDPEHLPRDLRDKLRKLFSEE
jgi:superfamily I DNA and RNA helicase